jgi:CRISPR-associated protein Cmr4
VKTRGYLIHALSPLHAGVGQGSGLVDLPIAREATTRHPLLPGSSVKGVLRAEASRANEIGRGSMISRLFGPSGEDAHEHAGAIRISDARILLFPVRSDFGTFAWVSCPFVLHRWLRDLGDAVGFGADAISSPKPSEVSVPEQSLLIAQGAPGVVLGGLPFARLPQSPKLGQAIGAALFPKEPWWQAALSARLAIVHDDLFGWLVETATDVRAHIRIGPNGVVMDGALWYEETLPPETVLAGLVQFAPNNQPIAEADAWRMLEGSTTAPIQLGGGATTGHGLARVRWLGSAS